MSTWYGVYDCDGLDEYGFNPVLLSKPTTDRESQVTWLGDGIKNMDVRIGKLELPEKAV